jgi:hypothetical protein
METEKELLEYLNMDPKVREKEYREHLKAQEQEAVSEMSESE